jgi:hypothetical protein
MISLGRIIFRGNWEKAPMAHHGRHSDVPAAADVVFAVAAVASMMEREFWSCFPTFFFF